MTLTAPPHASPSSPPTTTTATWQSVADVAVAVGEPLNLARVLGLVVRNVRQLLDADRVTVLLTDEAEEFLVPSTSVARCEDATLWERFLTMPPISLPRPSPEEESFRAGQVLVIQDASTSPLVPPVWRDSFGLVSLVIAPLLVDGELLGALVVEGPRFTQTENLAPVQAVAGLAAAAVRSARGQERLIGRMREVEFWLDSIEDLNESSGLHRTSQAAIDGLITLLAGRSCSINVFADGDHVHTVASRGDGQPDPGFYSLDAFDPQTVTSLGQAWADDPHRTFVFDAERRQLPTGPFDGLPDRFAVIVPFGRRAVQGFAVVSTDAAPNTEQLRLGRALAGQGWVATDRARLSVAAANRSALLEELRATTDESGAVSSLAELIQRLAPVVRSCLDVELIEAVLSETEPARLLSAQPPRGALVGMIRAWRRDAAPTMRAMGGLLVVPMCTQDGVIGALSLRRTASGPQAVDDSWLLQSVADAIASVAVRAVRRSRLDAATRRLAYAEERGRISNGLHVALEPLLARVQERLHLSVDTDPTLRSNKLFGEAILQIKQARRELAETTPELTAMAVRAEGLAGSLRAFGRGWQQRTGVDVQIRISGEPATIGPDAEVALLRVVMDALSRLARSARAKWVIVDVRTQEDATTEVEVRIDGIGLAQLQEQQPATHRVIRTLQRRMEDAAGTLTVRDIGVGLSLLARISGRKAPESA
jgi:signal transduction histidine kinase